MHIWRVHDCIVSQATNEQVKKKTLLLSDMHLRNLRQKLQLQQKMKEIANKLEVSVGFNILLIQQHPQQFVVVASIVQLFVQLKFECLFSFKSRWCVLLRLLDSLLDLPALHSARNSACAKT